MKAIRVDHVIKEYQLGSFGGKTLKGDIQSLMAKMRGKEDPNTIIGSPKVTRNSEKFRALDDVSFSVEKGEVLGIIGHNGAGKSTLLKLLSRVTAPTDGKISYNGRIASMLEVGTGFHPELTGVENIYLNGAILGMTKAEIRRKQDEIIQFAEMEKFIETPVKRYSSGMYVKLAFAVAAHLDSEIMVMDEVLAVGDMKFQQKCLGKMGDAANNEGKTVLYVSHNMATIRNLCTRCIVLDHGKIIYDGETEEAISLYSDSARTERFTEKDLTNATRYTEVEAGRVLSITYLKLIGKESNIYTNEEELVVRLTVNSDTIINHPLIRFTFIGAGGYAVAYSLSEKLNSIRTGENVFVLSLPLKEFTAGVYSVTLVVFEMNEFGASSEKDVVVKAFSFEIVQKLGLISNPWAWGFVKLPDMKSGE